MKKCLVLMMLSAFVFVACKEPEPEKPKVAEVGNTLALNFTHLPHLDGGYYAVWIEVKDKGLVLVDTFAVPKPSRQDEGKQVAFKTTIQWTSPDTLKATSKCLISVEKRSATTLPTAPASVLLSGSVDPATAEVSLSVDGEDAFGKGFIDKMKAFKPSALVRGYTASDAKDSSAGVWFVKPDGTTGLEGLPTLPANGKWKYEGWFVRNGHPAMIDSMNKTASTGSPTVFPMPVSMGKFTAASGADEDGNPYHGTGSATPPAFPGGDFIAGTSPVGTLLSFPASFTYADAVSISIEPADDNEEGKSFPLRPFGLLNMQTYAHTIETFRYRGAAALTAQLKNTVLNGQYTLGIPTSGQFLPEGTASLKKK